jgi:protein-disulfide isomerase
MKPFYYILGGIAVVGGVLIAMNVMGGGGSASMEPEAKMANATSEELVLKAKGITRGDPNAKVKLMVFSDYMCPGCGVFATSIEPQIRSTFGDRVTEVYHDFPLISIHKYAFLAARAGRCAEDQAKFWELHDVLFANQRTWSFTASAPLKEFSKYATDAGLDQKAFDECLRSSKHTDLVTANMELGDRVGVSSTPTVYINGRMSVNAMNWDIIRSEIEQALGSAGTTPAPAAPAPAPDSATTGQ